MRAIEDLLNDVRDRGSRVQFADAVRAYGAGAFRATIVSTWVAVALDLTSKIRELADVGDAAAAQYVSKLDAAIAAGNVRELAALERDLLTTCQKPFALIGDREALELARLQADRHVCAHPAYVAADEVFTPTAELCRLHMRTAVDAVLAHPPAPGRKTIDRFFAEAKGAAWPSDRAAVAAHLDARYLQRGKPTLHSNLAEVIVKGCIDAPEESELLASRMTDAAHALHECRPELLATALQKVVRKREDTHGLSDVQLLRLLGSLGSLTVLWEALPNSSHPRAVAALAQGSEADLIRLRVTSEPLANPGAAAELSQRLNVAPVATLTAFVTTAPGPVLLPVVLNQLEYAGGWRIAEQIMALLPPLAGHFTRDEVACVAKILRTNRQVRESSGVPQQLSDLFERTKSVPGALGEWLDLSDWLQGHPPNGDRDHFFAYPGLAADIACYVQES